MMTTTEKVKIVIAGGGFAKLSVQAEVDRIDVEARAVRCIAGVGRLEVDLEFDHLLVALGAETNSFDVPGVAEWAVTMKSLADSALLRNRVVALLEEAALQSDEAARCRLLTFVAAGGGFAGVEAIGALNDFVRDAVRYYPELNETVIPLVVVHPGQCLLPELGDELGRYAERKLSERGVDIITGARVARYDGSVVELHDGTAIPAETLIWTAGVSVARERSHTS